MGVSEQRKNPFVRLKLLAGLFSFIVLSGCDSSSNGALNSKQIAADQKRFMQQVNACFLRQYASVEAFNLPISDVASALRAQCLDEFSALRAARLNYAMVRDVIEPPPKMVQFEVEMAEVFIESARSRAASIFKHHPHPPISPLAPKKDDSEENQAF